MSGPSGLAAVRPLRGRAGSVGGGLYEGFYEVLTALLGEREVGSGQGH